MCVSRPVRVETVDGGTAEVQWQGHLVTVDVSPVGPVVPGDYLLVHAGLALEKVDPQEVADLEELLVALASAELVPAHDPTGLAPKVGPDAASSPQVLCEPHLPD
jgi:hydrogenase expression/formation protein HypC